MGHAVNISKIKCTVVREGAAGQLDGTSHIQTGTWLFAPREVRHRNGLAVCQLKWDCL